jgi:hypothetical protein
MMMGDRDKWHPAGGVPVAAGAVRGEGPVVGGDDGPRTIAIGQERTRHGVVVGDVDTVGGLVVVDEGAAARR